MYHILILNGPNLNLLGSREPEVYGTDTLPDIMEMLTVLGTDFGCRVEHFQSNSEGTLVERIHEAAQDGTQFVVINPGAYAHTSIALRDAFLGVDMPFIEVHISNVFSREEFRHHSYLSDIAVGVVTGLGIHGYEMALRGACAWLAIEVEEE